MVSQKSKFLNLNSSKSTKSNQLNKLCYISSVVAIGLLVTEKKIFKRVLPYMDMAAIAWSCDPDATNKLLFDLPNKAPHKI